MDTIKTILLISGKRKSGKDYIANKLQERLGRRSQIIRISEPIKSEWAKKHNLNLEELLSASHYKEQYRKSMIEWSDEVRALDYGYFCRAAMAIAQAEIVIVSDIRRKNDIKFFSETYGTKVKTLRINCSEVTRKERGWSFTSGIDDVQSECDLDDDLKWDLIICNESESKNDNFIELILKTFEF